MEEERPLEPAPEGASCAKHPERDALVTCPRCGSYCCIACWQGAPRRCHDCLLRDPGPPVPWVEEGRGPLSRFFATIYDAFRPRASAARFTRGEVRPAVIFFALTFIPLALLSGVIPYTHTLGFAPPWRVLLLGAPSQGALLADVAGAMGIGLLVCAAKLALLGAAYVSIARAYGQTLPSRPGIQAMLYRGWLLPLSGSAGIVTGVFAWGVHLEPESTTTLIAEIISVLPLVALFASMHATARQGHGVGPIASLAVVLVPFLAMAVMEPLLFGALSPIIPSGEAIREAVQAASP